MEVLSVRFRASYVLRSRKSRNDLSAAYLTPKVCFDIAHLKRHLMWTVELVYGNIIFMSNAYKEKIVIFGEKLKVLAACLILSGFHHN